MDLLKVLAILSFFFVFVLSLPRPSPSLPSVHEKKTGCIKVNHCKCIMVDGSGVINLAALGDYDGYLERFKPITSVIVPKDQDLLFSFNPCIPFSEPEGFASVDCLEVAACLIARNRKSNRYLSHYADYGRHEGNEFQYNNSFKTLTVSYPVPSRGHPQTTVHYHCSPNYSVSASQRLDGGLEVWVDSPCACPNACALEDVGPGTILLIILCLSAAAYFLLGSCALRPFRTGKGVQIAPEESVWCVLCYHFTGSRGKRPKRHLSLKEETL